MVTPTFKLPVSGSVGHPICCFQLLVETPRQECTQHPARWAGAYDQQQRGHLYPTGWLVPNRVCKPGMNLLALPSSTSLGSSEACQGRGPLLGAQVGEAQAHAGSLLTYAPLGEGRPPPPPASCLLTVAPGPALQGSETEIGRQSLLGGGGVGRGLNCSCSGVTPAPRTHLVSALGGCRASEDKLFHVVGRIQFPVVVGLGFPAGHTRPSPFLQAGSRGSLLGCTGVS